MPWGTRMAASTTPATRSERNQRRSYPRRARTPGTALPTHDLPSVTVIEPRVLRRRSLRRQNLGGRGGAPVKDAWLPSTRRVGHRPGSGPRPDSVPPMPSSPNQGDAEFLGLTATEDDPGHCSMTVVDRLARFDGRLYGGAAIAASIAAAEVVSGRTAVWMTTQFVSTTELGTDVDITAEVLAPGKRTNQVRVTGTGPDGQVVFASLGATGHRRPDGITGEFERGPTVTPPDEAHPWTNPFSAVARAAGIDVGNVTPPKRGFATSVDMREPDILDHPDPGVGRVCLWVRRRDRQPITPAVAGYMADMVPMSIAHALGEMVGGTSLDNTIRIGSFTDTEWVLLDLRPHLAAGGYGHGVAHVWSEDGQLLATASQTASMFRFD